MAQMPPAPPGMPQQQQQWMPVPQGIPGCPPGLEYLAQIDQILVHQVVELLEAFTGWETQNKYAIKNTMGQQVYYAFEESNVCMRQCCGPNRAFEMHIVDNMNREVIRVKRDFKCCACGCPWFACCECCSHELKIESPPGETIGYVRQSCSFWIPTFQILDDDKKEILTIKGPCCVCQGLWCFDQKFEVKAGDTEIGKICKQFTGFVKEVFTDADNFGVTFPMDLDVKMKAVLVGAVFLIDFMFFENKNNNN